MTGISEMGGTSGIGGTAYSPMAANMPGGSEHAQSARDNSPERAQSARDNSNEQWIPILDYAVQRGVSTSTLRRYIKAKKIQYKVENGRYLLKAEAKSAINILPPTSGVTNAPLDLSVFTRVRELEEKLAQAQEQISELKMLVAIYEEKLPD